MKKLFILVVALFSIAQLQADFPAKPDWFGTYTVTNQTEYPVMIVSFFTDYLTPEEDANFGVILDPKTNSKAATTKFFDAPLISARTNTFLVIGINDSDQPSIKPSNYTPIESKNYTITIENGQFQIH